MRKQNSDFEARFISEEGSRLKNRDYFGYVELDEFACYVIADGITEVTDVESARLAIETVILSFQENPSLSKRAVKRLLKRANRALLGKESDRRLKASITVVVTDYQKMRYGYVGNTRLRMYRGGAVYRQTRDMSLAQEMVEQEKIAKDELMQHEERNNLYAYLGQKNFKPVVSKKIKLAETDMIALYTRGIWENVDEAELDDVFAEADNEVQTTVDNIEDLLLSRQPENLDNYTLAVIFVNKVYQNPEKRKRIKKIVMITVIVVIAAIVIGVVLWFLRDRKVQRTEDMNYHFTNTVEYINTGNYVRAKEECEQAQKLAEKLKDSSMRTRLQEYSFVIETVILADESYSSADYEAAEEYYLSALDRTRYADNVGTDYIENKLENISVFLSVEDYINLGDSLLEQGDYDGAEEKYLLAKKAALSVHDAEGKQTAMDSLEKLYEEKGVNPTKELSVHTGQFFRVMSTEYIKLYPGTKEMLKELKKAGKNVYLLSNAQRIFTAYEMRRLDIFDLFDDVFISSDYNTKKPDIRFYKELINKHDIDVSKSLFIGNDSTTDIKGAKECRMDAFYVKSNISPKDDMAHDADYIIDNFTNW